MRTQHIEIFESYTIDDHPDPDSVYQWIRDNWHDLGEHYVYDAIESIKGFTDHFGINQDYCVGIVPDRGERISFIIDDIGLSEMSGIRLWKYINNSDSFKTLLNGECPFTGVCYDEDLLDVFRSFLKKPDNRSFQDLMDEAGSDLLESLHSQGEYLYSDKGIKEMCEANEYEFTQDGAIA